jgi:hypothetical protein
MVLKALAVVRTIFLIFLIGYTVRARPFWDVLSKTFDEQYARCADNLAGMSRAAWIAIAWIAFETLVGWWIAARAGRKALAAGAPPVAPTR